MLAIYLQMHYTICVRIKNLHAAQRKQTAKKDNMQNEQFKERIRLRLTLSGSFHTIDGVQTKRTKI